ncbi:restriction endonuclease [Nocardia exalbida]|uniref:restriction endonuclease n=1 Tax=Nocardia exalbida TaxID=290231 RepID=UPI000A05B2C5|nr:restriction endonuclease [Nocardia exalbida]
MGSVEDANRLWERYELSVRELLAAIDPGSEVSHNVIVAGQLSGVKRQLDVLARGMVVGVDITVVVECKRHQRPVDIGTMDRFIGKLLDVGADRGILYSYSGFTNSAVQRAIGAKNPFAIAIAVETPEIVQQLGGVAGYPADLMVQDVAPQWIEEMDEDNFARFLKDGEWSKFWS